MKKSKKAMAITSSPMQGKSMDDYKYDEHGVRSAVDTLMKAEEHKADPKMMDLVHKHIGKQKKAIKSIQDLKDRAKEMSVNDHDEDD